ncbi:MAG: hypothetical protein HY543_01095 [Deltaproteobacteria bacterium]|nr:hypothetical protein [Deltaproteobacteria bacterium]
MDIARFRMWLAVAATAAAIGSGPAFAADPAPTCDDIFSGASAPVVTKAYEYRHKKDPDSAEAKSVHLGSVITIEGTNLNKLFEGLCAKRGVVLYINGLPMPGLTIKPPTNPKESSFNFTLRRADSVRDAWVPVLGSPLSNSGDISVSMGFKDGFAVNTADADATTLHFDIVPPWWFLWAIVFFAVLGLFIYFARRSNIIRDPSPVLDDTPGTYSLSRLQGAWWFFVIIASYIFIGVITGDFSNTVNSTALILLGIGAGTVVGSAAIDAQKDTDEQRAATIAAVAKITKQINDGKADITKFKKALAADKVTEADALKAKSDLAVQEEMNARLNSQLKKLEGLSEGILKDILSDANGISFHRFQIAVWTLVLSIIFVIDVYQNLAMPEFNTTLMSMMGLSAGTYLGLKIPEPTTPSKPPLGATA